MRVTLSLPQEDLRLVPDAARAAEAAGYDGLVTSENRHDPFLPLAVAATVTEKVRLDTGIAISFPRSPMVVANMGWDLQVASRGRTVIGLGSQIRPHNEKRFSVPWSPPAPRMKEYIQSLRAIWRCWKTGERLNFQGKHYNFTLMTPNFTPEAMEHAPPAVTISAVGPAMLRLAGEVCDGVRLHPFCTRKYLDETIMPELEEGWRRGGKARENFEIIGGGFIATGPDAETVEKMFDWVRKRIGFYGSTPAYWGVLEAEGYGDLGRKLNAMSKQGQWEEMTAEIPDDLVHQFCAVGDYSVIADRIAEKFGDFSDSVSARIAPFDVGEPDWPTDLLQEIQRIDTPFKGFAAFQ